MAGLRISDPKAKVRVLIATTKGPVAVEGIFDLEPGGYSTVAIGSTAVDVPGMLRNYVNFIAKSTGVIARSFGHDAFRLELSSEIHAGESWQLPVFLAHGLHRQGRLAEKGKPADAVVWATGLVDYQLRVAEIGHVPEKIANSIDRLTTEKETGAAVHVVWPAANEADADDSLEDRLAAIADIHAVDEIADLLRAFDIDLVEPAHPITLWRGSPFRGLQAFDAAHRAVFFGRGQAREETRECLRAAAVRDCAFLLIYGASGSGKSSLARAGLIGDVIHGVGGTWRTAIVIIGRSGAWPLDTLAAALLVAVPDLRSDAEALAARLRERPKDVAADVAAALGADATTRGERLILLIDQFEDLFLWAKEQATAAAETEREAFATALNALARSGSVWVIATFRSDLLPLLEVSPAASRLATNERRYALKAPSRAELRQIVMRPAEMAGITLEGVDPSGLALSDVFVEAAASNPASLPLLQFALERLYLEEEQTGSISYAGYKRIGGIEGAIGGWADKTVALLDEKAGDGRDVDDVLLALGRLDGDGGNVVARVATMATDFTTPARRAVVEALERARLVTLDNDEATGGDTVRVSHEALLTHWDRAKQVFEDHVNALVLRDRLDKDARDWIGNPDERDLLPEGRMLSAAIEVRSNGRVQFSPAALEFIAASERKANADAAARQKRQADAEAEKLAAQAERERAQEEKLQAAHALAALQAASRAERELEQEERLQAAQKLAAVSRRSTVQTRFWLVAAIAAGVVIFVFALKSRQETQIAEKQTIMADLNSEKAQKAQLAAEQAAQDVIRAIDKAREAEMEIASSRADENDTALDHVSLRLAPYFHRGKGNALSRSGNIDSSLAQQNAVLAQSPERADVLGSRAYGEVLIGSGAAAQRDAEAAGAVRHASSDAQNLALAHAMQGHYADAEKALDLAIRNFRRPEEDTDSLLAPEITATTHRRALTLVGSDFVTALRYSKAVLFAMSGDRRFAQAFDDIGQATRGAANTEASIHLVVSNWAWLIARGQVGSGRGRSGYPLQDYGILAAEGRLWEQGAGEQTAFLVVAKRHYNFFQKAYGLDPQQRYAALAAYVEGRLKTPALMQTVVPNDAADDDPRALLLVAEEAKARTSDQNVFQNAVPLQKYDQVIAILEARRARGTLAHGDFDLLLATRINRAELKASTNDKVGAAEDASAVIALDPNYAVAYRVRAATRGDAAAQADDYRRAIELDPASATARSELAKLIGDKEPAKAIALMEQKARLQFLWSGDRWRMATWGLALASTRKGEERVRTLRAAHDAIAAAIEIDPSDKTSYSLRRAIELALDGDQTAADAKLIAGLRNLSASQARIGASAPGLVGYMQALRTALDSKDPGNPEIQFEIETTVRALTSFLVDLYDINQARSYWRALSNNRSVPQLVPIAQRELKRIGGST